MIIVSRHVIVASLYLNGKWHTRQPLGECLINSAIKTCEAPENPHQDGEHIPWKLESGDKTAVGWVETPHKSHNEVVDQAKYFLILSENLGKRRRKMHQTELWRLFTSAPILNEKLASPPFNTAALSLKTSTTRPHRNWLLKVLHQLAGWDWLFSWLSIDCELEL